MTADLFDSVPIARRQDPATSQNAAAKYSKTTRVKDVDLMYDLIFENPGRTAGEYAEILRQSGVNWYRAARLPTKRISDLIKAGRLHIGTERTCAVTGDTARTYFALPE